MKRLHVCHKIKQFSIGVDNLDLVTNFWPFKKNVLKFFVDLTIRFTMTKCRPKFAENCCAHKVSHKCSSNYCHFFTILTFIFENRLFFADFFQFVKQCMLQVRHDKHVHKINSNKRKISCYSLKFSLKSLLFDDVYKILKFMLI